MSSARQRASRARSGSLQEALKEIERDPAHRIAGALNPNTPLPSIPGSPYRPSSPANAQDASQGFWNDIITVGWMKYPSSSFKMLIIPIILYVNWELFAPEHDNPWRRLLWVSGRLPDREDGAKMYAKSWWDLAFIFYWVIVWSFIRQSLFIYVLKPLARHWRLKEVKQDRFAEMAYAIMYFSFTGSLGLWTMYKYLPTWYFKTEYFWKGYPHWQMAGTLKPYYLLEASYWVHQFVLLALKVEKPRSDYKEYVAHHIVTLWLVGWSYLINLTLIGNAVYLTMDWSDVFLSLSQIFNYLKMERTKTVAFAFFTCVWTYTRHYLNLVILYSVWTEFDLIAPENKVWNPASGAWLTWWMKYQIFLPLLALQFLNLFWYFLIWRILLRAIFSSKLDDERSDNEDDGEDGERSTKKNGLNGKHVKGKKNGKA